MANSLTTMPKNCIRLVIGRSVYFCANKLGIIEFAASMSNQWGRDATVKWLMKQMGWNLATSLRVICLIKILSSAAAENQE